jgi:DNA-directed RNA polymerase subunit RPC12/RpoP
MWVCRNCNEVNDDDGLAACKACSIDRNVVIATKGADAGWICMSCGKKNGIRLARCPVCNTRRFVEGVDGEATDPAPEPDRRVAEAVERVARRIVEMPVRGKALCAGAILALVLLAWLAASSRSPSDGAARLNFETTELTRINSSFICRSADNVEAVLSEVRPGMTAVADMRARLAQDCGNALPSAVCLEKAREGNGPEYFKRNLVQLAGAVDGYLAAKIGPTGDGYSLKRFRVTDRRKDGAGGSATWTLEYEATLVALGDVTLYRPPYIEGQEFAPLAESDAVNWANVDRFYKAYLDRDGDRVKAVAAEFNRNRAVRICAKGGTQVLTGKMTFEKTDEGWKAIP